MTIRDPFRALRLAPIALWLCLSACQASAGARVRQDLHAFQREQTSEKLFERGQGFAQVGDTTRAQEYLDAALEAGGDEAKILPLLLGVCVRDGRYRLAVEYARRHLSQRPDDHKLRFVLGTLYLALGEPESAERELDLVAKVSDPDAEVHYAFAVLMRDHKSNGNRAAAHFREYLRLDPQGEHANEARAALVSEAQ